MGTLYRIKGEYKTAIKCFEYILVVPPPQKTRADVVLAIALVREEQGNMKHAGILLQQLLKQPITNKYSAQASQQLGWTIYRAIKQAGNMLWNEQESVDSTNFALSMLNRARTFNPNDYLPHYYIGRMMEVGNATVAFAAYQQAFLLEPDNVAIWNSIAILYHRSKQYKDALEAYSKAVQIKPLLPELWWNLGQLYEVCNGGCRDAVEAFIRAKQLCTSQDMFRAIANKLDSNNNWIGSNSIKKVIIGNNSSPLLFQLNPRNYTSRPLTLITPEEQKPVPYLSTILK